MADGMLIECRLLDFISKSLALHHFEHISTPPKSCYKDINVRTSHLVTFKFMFEWFITNTEIYLEP